MPDADRALAVFIDFENMGLGFQGRRDRFDIARVLERMVEKGKLVVKKAYADWNRFVEYTRSLHEAAIELEALVSLLPSEKSRQLAQLQVKASHKQSKEFRDLAQKVKEN